MRWHSVRGMMAVVVVCAFGMAGLRNANELWGGVLLLLALFALGAAILAAVYGSRAARPAWVGFALFEAGYLLLAFGPWFNEQIQPKLATAWLLDYVNIQVSDSPGPTGPSLRGLQDQRRATLQKFEHVRRLVRTESDPTLVALTKRLATLDGDIVSLQGAPFWKPTATTSTPLPKRNRWQSLLPGARNYEPFLRVGHSLFALLAGVLGAMLAVRFHAARARRGVPDHTPLALPPTA